MILSVTAPQRCLLPWLVPPGKYWRSESATTVTPEFFSSLQQVAGNVANNPDMHLMIDNSGTHQQAKGKEWLAERPRFHYTHLRVMDH